MYLKTEKWLINRKHGQGTHSARMGADSSAESTWNASLNFSPICLPKLKSLRFLKKTLRVSVVRGFIDCDAGLHLHVQDVDEIAFLFEL